MTNNDASPSINEFLALDFDEKVSNSSCGFSNVWGPFYTRNGVTYSMQWAQVTIRELQAALAWRDEQEPTEEEIERTQKAINRQMEDDPRGNMLAKAAIQALRMKA